MTARPHEKGIRHEIQIPSIHGNGNGGAYRGAICRHVAARNNRGRQPDDSRGRQ